MHVCHVRCARQWFAAPAAAGAHCGGDGWDAVTAADDDTAHLSGGFAAAGEYHAGAESAFALGMVHDAMAAGLEEFGRLEEECKGPMSDVALDSTAMCPAGCMCNCVFEQSMFT
jgi:hypothetical protein